MEKFHKEDVVIVIVCVLVIAGISLISHIYHPPAYVQPIQQSPLKTLINPTYISPNRTRLNLDEAYQSGDITYEVEQGNTNVSNDNVNNQTYYVVYVNLTDQSLTLNSPSLYIGCIATPDQTYKQIPSLFDDSVERGLDLPPFNNPTQVQISVNPRCLFLGTADGQYYWQLF